MLVDATQFRAIRTSPQRTGLLLAATGLAIWTGLSAWNGMEPNVSAIRFGEAWDTNAYFLVGLPIMAGAVGAAAFHIPDRCWRWPLWLVAGHQVGLLAGGLGMQSSLSLAILAVILALLLAAVFAVPALIGSCLSRRYRPHRGEWGSYSGVAINGLPAESDVSARSLKQLPPDQHTAYLRGARPDLV